MRQRSFIIDELARGVSSGKVESQYFVGTASPFGHSIEQPFDRMRCGSLVVPRGEVHANGGEAGSKRRVRSLPPGNAAPCLFCLSSEPSL